MSKELTIVVKIGSSLLANEDKLTLRYAFMYGLMQDIHELTEAGHKVIITSSGSVALGLTELGETPETATVKDKQAAAAYGQPLLMNAYRSIGSEHELSVAQLLVTLDDMQGRRRFLSIQDTLKRLMESDIVPIVNENDTVAIYGENVGDNDRLAAQVAHMVDADYLVILTSVDGLYDRNPEDPDAQFIHEVDDLSDHLESTRGTSGLGSGGMYTKIHAASLAQNAGTNTLIAEGIIDSPVSSVVYNKRRHTLCRATKNPTSQWDVWLTNRLHESGSITVLDTSAIAIINDKRAVTLDDLSSVKGTFNRGDVIHLYNEEDEEWARGVTSLSSEEIAILLSADSTKGLSDLLRDHTSIPALIEIENLAFLGEDHLTWEGDDEDGPKDIQLDQAQDDAIAKAKDDLN